MVTPGQGRHPATASSAPPSSRSSSRRSARSARRPTHRQAGQPGWLGPERPRSCPASWSTSPNFGLLGHFSLLGSFSKIGVVVGPAARLHADARRLLRHDGHDRRVGAEAGLLDEDGQPAEVRRDPARRLARRRGRWRGVGLLEHDIHRVRLGCRRGRPHRARVAWSPGCCSCCHLPVTPLVEVVPYEAATPALVVVGFLMMHAGARHRLGRPRDRHPGVPHDRPDAVHVLDHGRHRCGFRRRTSLIKVVRGKASVRSTRCCGPSSGLFVLYFAIDPVKQLLGVH